MDFSKPPSSITSGGYKCNVNSVRIFVSKGDPRKSENNWFGFGVYDMQFFYYRGTGLWWDTHSKADHNLTGLQVFDRLKTELAKKPDVYVGIALELQLSSANDGLMKAAVRDQPVVVDTWKNVPFKRSKNEMQVLAVYEPKQIASFLGKPEAAVVPVVPVVPPKVAEKPAAVVVPPKVAEKPAVAPVVPPKVAEKPAAVPQKVAEKPVLPPPKLIAAKPVVPPKPVAKPVIPVAKPAPPAKVQAAMKPKPELDLSRPCDSRSRAPNRYTRAELEALALAHDIDPKGKNMSQICSALTFKPVCLY